MKDKTLREALDNMGIIEDETYDFGGKISLRQKSIKDALARMQLVELERNYKLLVKYLGLELNISTTKYVKIKNRG